MSAVSANPFSALDEDGEGSAPAVAAPAKAAAAPSKTPAAAPAKKVEPKSNGKDAAPKKDGDRPPRGQGRKSGGDGERGGGRGGRGKTNTCFAHVCTHHSVYRRDLICPVAVCLWESAEVSAFSYQLNKYCTEEAMYLRSCVCVFASVSLSLCLSLSLSVYRYASASHREPNSVGDLLYVGCARSCDLMVVCGLHRRPR
jgi:hypothetical protein